MPKIDKVDKKKLIESLIKQAKELSFEDKDGLDKFRKRASMIIHNIFEGRGGYSAQLLNIDLYPRYMLRSFEEHTEYWRRGRQEILNLLETILEEMELFGERKDMVAGLSEKEAREQFLLKLNDLSKGDVTKFIDTMSIGDALGFDRATTFSCARYFDKKGYIERRDDAYGAISIRAEGIDEADRIKSIETILPSDQGDLPEEKYFPPNSHLEIQSHIARLLRQAKASLWICDGYMDDKIVEEIIRVRASEIRFLTSKYAPLFIQRLNAAKKQFPEKQIEANKYDKFMCHDRYYFIDQDQVWSFGTSYNQAGGKATFLTKVKAESVRLEITRDFKVWWDLATKIETSD
jgi:hypothetical protein